MSVTTAQNAYLDAAAAAKMLALGLPAIRGKYFFVDPLTGSASSDGLTPSTAFATLRTAYDACTTNIGDGICVLSADATTSSNTTSYLSFPLLWTKNSITVFGVCAPTRMAQRARIGNLMHTTGSLSSILTFTRGTVSPDVITRSTGSFITNLFAVGDKLNIVTAGTANDAVKGCTVAGVTAGTLTLDTTGTLVTEAAGSGQTVTTYTDTLITVSGSNNSFYNLHMTNTGTNALDLNCLTVSGTRNYFSKVHAGVGIASAITVLGYSLSVAGGAEENTFEGCVFGLDTVDRGNNASYDILLGGALKRNRFFDCETIGYASTGTAKLAVYLNATNGGQPTVFDHCRFLCNNVTEMTAAFSGTGSQGKHFITGMSCHPGYAALAAAGSVGGAIYFNGATNASAVGGIASKT